MTPKAPRATYTHPDDRAGARRPYLDGTARPVHRRTLRAWESGGRVNVSALPILPAWQYYTTDSGVPKPGEPVAWSHLCPPPAIGSLVNVRCNGIGPARVISYCTDAGFLALEVVPLNPPAWYTGQNGADCSCTVFGAEI